MFLHTALQSQNTVSAHFKSKQTLLFGFVEPYSTQYHGQHWTLHVIEQFGAVYIRNPEDPTRPDRNEMSV